MFHAIYSSNPDSLEVTSLEYPSNSSSVAGMIGEPKDVSHMLQSFCLCKTKTIASRHCWSLFAEVRSFALSGCLHGRNAKSRHAICRIVFRQERGRLQEDSRSEDQNRLVVKRARQNGVFWFLEKGVQNAIALVCVK